ncbi:MAG: signal peptidase II [Clostridiales Family XIII bacterium]|nr:signal peptidase II [Clostridiales Family XIII bacterium]
MTGIRAFIHCLAVVAIVLVADRVTKSLVETFIPVGGAVPGMDSFVKLLHVLNDGVAFSMFQGHRMPLIIFQSVLVLVITIVIFVAYRHLKDARRPLMVMTAFSLMLGGGLGNLWDRVSAGFVTDFVSIGKFAVFNTADACLVVGCGLLILYILRYAHVQGPGSDEVPGPRESGGPGGPDGVS